MSINVKPKNLLLRPNAKLLGKESICTNIKVVKKGSLLPQHQNNVSKTSIEAKVKSKISKENLENDRNNGNLNAGNISSRHSGIKKKISFEDCKMTSESKEKKMPNPGDDVIMKSSSHDKGAKIIKTEENVFKPLSSRAISINNLKDLKRPKKVEPSPLKTATISLNLENLKINQENKPTFTNEEQRRVLSYIVNKEYGNCMIQSLLEKEYANDECLYNHKITERMRMRMVDWMIEVFTNYKCDNLAFFESINIMDSFFKKSKKKLNPEDLHLIGVASMFMASKFVDIYPLRIKTVYEKISHKKLSISEIIEKEAEISQVLNYTLGMPNSWDFINTFIQEIFYVGSNGFQITNKTLLKEYIPTDKNTKIDKDAGNKFLKSCNDNLMNLIKHVCIYLAKMNCHDYHLMSKKPSLLAASTIFVAMKICEQINKEDYVNDNFTARLSEVSKIVESDIIKCAQKILYNAQNFETVFSGLENLKKIHFNAIIELKQTK